MLAPLLALALAVPSSAPAFATFAAVGPVPQSGICGYGNHDSVPPGGGSSEEVTGVPGGATRPRPALGGASPGSKPPGNGPMGPLPLGPPPSIGPAPAAAPLGPIVGPPLTSYDRLSWETWWRVQQDRFLDVRERVRRRHVMGTVGLSAIARQDLPPSDHQIETEVVPALVETLNEARSDKLILSSLVALARIGTVSTVGTAGVSIAAREAAIVQHLKARSQDVSETAALALGILGSPGAYAGLRELLDNTDKGAALVKRGRVPERTRSFAAYGLGLMGHASSTEVGLRQRIALTLLDLLARAPGKMGAAHMGPAQTDVLAATTLALGQCRLPARPTMPPADLARHPLAEAVMSSSGMARFLTKRLGPRKGAREASTRSTTERAYGLTALATHASSTEGRLREDVLDLLRREAMNRRRSTEVRSAAVLAIGELASSAGSIADRQALSFLGKLMTFGQPLERRLGSLALAQASASAGPGDDPLEAAGPAARELHKMYLRGGSQERPWGALAAGVQAFHLNKAAGGGIASPLSARAVQQRAELLKVLSKERSAASIGAFGLGVALTHAHASEVERAEAGKILSAAYGRTHEPMARGHLAIGLGLLEHKPASDAILKDLGQSLANPAFVWHAAVALGLMGDDRLTPALIDAMLEARAHGTRAAAAVALGTVGDQRAVTPLLQIMGDKSHPTASRSMAIVGLGILCEGTELPWRTPLSNALPYPALTETLGGSGNALFDMP